MHNEKVCIDLYKSYGDSPEISKPLSRKKRYELVKPNLYQIKHDLLGIKGSKKRRQQKKKTKKTRLATSEEETLCELEGF